MMTSISTLCPRRSIHVREIHTQDGALLLDINQGLCLALTPVAAMIWELLAEERSLDEIAEHLSSAFGEARELITRDLNDFLKNLSSRGLLETADTNGTQHATDLRRVLLRVLIAGNSLKPKVMFSKALIGFLAYDLCGFRDSFASIHAVVRDWPVAPGLASTDCVQRVCQAINYASMVYPRRILCLQRSVLTTILLRNRSVPAEIVIGAQKLPFKAHAWTEVNGRPINERRDVRVAYLVWDRC